MFFSSTAADAAGAASAAAPRPASAVRRAASCLIIPSPLRGPWLRALHRALAMKLIGWRNSSGNGALVDTPSASRPESLGRFDRQSGEATMKFMVMIYNDKSL